jgi:hypothetical protein
MQLCHFEVCGVWLLVGVLTGSDVETILLRHAQGTEMGRGIWIAQFLNRCARRSKSGTRVEIKLVQGSAS